MSNRFHRRLNLLIIIDKRKAFTSQQSVERERKANINLCSFIASHDLQSALYVYYILHASILLRDASP